ncbi:Glycosyl transferase family 2 [Tepidimonas thermarum]|uniref:Glycosyl transferase family 2 n=1 Tax=Tepidimonas thermarum TaxID=335431 RepID=A0A554WWN0_9BURK|nr:glycosyltransferase [Tepidimonas thermarum]TSE27975.1 Glycosyl transferase family 2 [Tepidimonas thermarum]
MRDKHRPLIGLTLNYRDAARTSRCVASLLADGADGVLVWDNSADGGRSAQALCQHWVHEPRVHIEVSTRNLGFSAGVNRGIDAALARWPQAWVLLINNDATLHRGALQTLAQALNAQPQAVVAYPRVDHDGQVIGTVYYQRLFALLRFDRAWPGSFSYPSGSALLIAPERIRPPLFDEDFFMYGEDVMLGWRLGASRMAHVPQVLAWHEGSASSRNGSWFYETHVVARNACGGGALAACQEAGPHKARAVAAARRPHGQPAPARPGTFMAITQPAAAQGIGGRLALSPWPISVLSLPPAQEVLPIWE